MTSSAEGSPSPSAPDPGPDAGPTARPSVIVVVTASEGTGTSDAPAPAPASVPVSAAASDSAPASVPTADPASASAPAPDSVPASASAPAQPIPEWVPPDTLNEKLSRWSRTLVKTAVTLLGLLILATFVIWLVPAVVLARSDEYRIAVEHAKQDPLLQEELGHPIATA